MKQASRWLAITIKLLGEAFVEAFVKFVDLLVHELFDVDKGQLKKIPNFVIFLIYVLCLSVIFQAGLDFVLEVLMLTDVIPKIPFRIDFIFLTLISTVIGIQTILGMSHHKLDVTRNSILIGIIVEVALIVGDLVLMIQSANDYVLLPYVRLPFLSLTVMNLFILIYVGTRMRVFRTRGGKLKLF